MYKRLFRPLKSVQTTRYSDLRGYLCIREGLNKETSAQLSSEFKRLQKKYQLDATKLTELISLLRLDYSLVSNYFPSHQISKIEGELNSAYERSSWFSSQNSLQRSQNILKLKYPEVFNYCEANGERLKALNQLEYAIFGEHKTTNLNIVTHNSIENIQISAIKNLKSLFHQINQEVKDKLALEQIEEALLNISNKIQNDPEYELLKLAFFFDQSLKRNSLSLITETENTTNILIDKNAIALQELEKGLSEQERKDLADIENVEFAKYIESQNSQNESELGKWINGKKLIFDSSNLRTNISPLWLIVLFGSGLSLTYFLLNGDAKYSTLAITGVLLAGSFLRVNNASIRNSANLVKNISINKDGKSANFSFSNGLNTENILLKDVQIFKGDKTNINVQKIFGQTNVKNVQTLGELRKKSWVPSSYYLRIGEIEALLPLEQTFEGKSFYSLLSGQLNSV